MTENDRQPFSEEAALRELEALQRQIEQSKVRRREANDAFDRFLRSFDRRVPGTVREAAEPVPKRAARLEPQTPDTGTPAPAPPPFEEPAPAHPPPDETLVLPPAQTALHSRSLTWPPSDLAAADHDDGLKLDVSLDPAPAAPPETAGPDLEGPQSLDAWSRHSEPSGATSNFPAESDVQAMSEATLPRETRVVPAALTAPVSRGRRRIPPAVSLLGVLVVAAALFLVWRGARRDPAVSTDPAAAAPSAAQPQPQPAVAAPAPTPAAVLAEPVAEVSTVRKVWVRVLVDGRRVVERELPADSRIPLQPTSQVQVRAGDAGAVRVSIRGKDQGPVGRDGEVATRSFTVTPTAVR